MINILLNDTLQCFILIGMMYFGTKLINYYYNFYHIYRYLDYDQKLGYFKSNILINIISKNIVVKRLIVYYMIIPLIKINYLFIQIFITLLYSLCYNEFKSHVNNQTKINIKLKKNKENIYNILITDSSNNNDIFDIDNNNVNDEKILLLFDEIDESTRSSRSVKLNRLSETSESRELDKSCKLDESGESNIFNKLNEIEKDNKGSNDDKNNLNLNLITDTQYNYDLSNIKDITSDYDSNISNIMNFISENNDTKIENNNKIYISKKNKFNSNDKITNNQIEQTNTNLNLFDELDLLKIHNTENKNIIKQNDNLDTEYVKIDNNFLNKKANDSDDDLSEYLVDKTFDSNNISNNLLNNMSTNISSIFENKNISSIFENKNIINIKDEQNDTINFEEIDFGKIGNIDDIDFKKIKEKELATLNIYPNIDKTKNIIKIGKKKNKQ